MHTVRTYKYMVVEDEYLIRENIIKKINSLNLPLELVGEASNGKDGLALVEALQPHLLITDIKMPQMDGLEFTKQLHTTYPYIKAVILSGYNDFTFAQQALRFGVKDFLLKPISVENLNTCLQKLVIMLDSEYSHTAALSVDVHTLSKEEISNLIEVYLHENFKKEISLSELAHKLGFTSDYLSRVFKKYKQESPIKYITKLRINEAKQLLINYPDLDIKKVGELVGYNDAFYFSRVFKTNTNLYPSEYRIKNHKL
ncbi:response regulator transcription factor [Cellulosilyticum sp. I15G10I2]|uniref:response regulator transcription factor n=1 Tax=Cellulosilyticum sp. I15G10I2 TaxID=1892843 RepID=UPI00085CB445|nr:response regulator [Cellulosilyticum sp. I15G10I2]